MCERSVIFSHARIRGILPIQSAVSTVNVSWCLLYSYNTQQFALVKICFSHKATRNSSSNSLHLRWRLVFKCFVFVLCVSFSMDMEGLQIIHSAVCQRVPALWVFVALNCMSLSLLWMEHTNTDFEDVYNEEIFLIIHIFRLIGIPPSIYMHLFIYLAMGRSGLFIYKEEM